jgi:hypothetical protein
MTEQEDFQTTIEIESLDEHQESGSIKYLRGAVSLLLLIVFGISSFQFLIDRTQVRIESVKEYQSNLQIDEVDISTLAHSTHDMSGEIEYFTAVEMPFNIPIEGESCFILDVRSEGYHPWEELVCPRKNQVLEIRLELVPLEMPLPLPDKLQT